MGFDGDFECSLEIGHGLGMLEGELQLDMGAKAILKWNVTRALIRPMNYEPDRKTCLRVREISLPGWPDVLTCDDDVVEIDGIDRVFVQRSVT